MIRTVGEAHERFREDRLRVLRALRFAGRFGFRIDPNTWDAAGEAAPELPHLSAERVREELLKVLKEVRRPSDSLALYEASGALAALYPELQACVGMMDGDEDVWSHLCAPPTPRRPAASPARDRAAARHGETAQRTGDGAFPGHASAGAAVAMGMMTRLKFSNAERDFATHLVAQHEDLPAPDAPGADVRRWLRLVGRAYVHDLLRLEIYNAKGRQHLDEERVRGAEALRRRADAVMRSGAALEINELAIGGGELRALGIGAGPRMGDILRGLLERVTDEPSLNTPDALTEIVRSALEDE